MAAAPAAAGQSVRAWGDESQTEYVIIPPKTKKRDRDALTDHQREIRQRQCQGDCLQEESRLVVVPCYQAAPSFWLARPTV